MWQMSVENNKLNQTVNVIEATILNVPVFTGADKHTHWQCYAAVDSCC